MGMFSWYRADNITKQTNFVAGDAIKILIPKEFGGGFIKGHYDGYGSIVVKESDEPKERISYDVYELLAFWNSDQITEEVKKKPVFPKGWTLRWIIEDYGEVLPAAPKESVYTEKNRCIGIALGCYDEEMAKLKYPLKLVSARYKGSYEDCKNFSLTDKDQGFYRKYD